MAAKPQAALSREFRAAWDTHFAVLENATSKVKRRETLSTLREAVVEEVKRAKLKAKESGRKAAEEQWEEDKKKLEKLRASAPKKEETIERQAARIETLEDRFLRVFDGESVAPILLIHICDADEFIVLVADGERVRVPKGLLSDASEAMRKLFDSGMAESKSGEIALPEGVSATGSC